MEDSKGGSSRLVFLGEHGEVVMYFNASAVVTSYDVVNRKNWCNRECHCLGVFLPTGFDARSAPGRNQRVL